MHRAEILYQNDMDEKNSFENEFFEFSLKNIVKWYDTYVIAQTVGIVILSVFAYSVQIMSMASIISSGNIC